MSSRSGSFVDCFDVGEQCGGSRERAKRWHKPLTVVAENPAGAKQVVKTYPSFVFPLTQYFRMLARHEYRMLKAVEGLPFTPNDVYRCADCSGALQYQHVEGVPLKELSRRGGVPNDFFVKLYASVQQMHTSGVVHFDLGNSGNVLCSPSGEPKIIDFGSAVFFRLLPGVIGEWARKKDQLGVLKLWYRFDRNSMPQEMQAYYQANYRKNIYTPRRFLKALKRSFMKPTQSTAEALPMAAIIGLFFGLLALVSLV
ncbi:hypothetical protein [Marinobacter sp. S0848L]|uniref:hypothetical protein n=1 Tax=Marinobacter sp. S0848L TaxID=2926423 RepID=UPI001FF69753|nr:hypothetical protein [Marinobacter sp. S0848L]MCK0105776.1 hypothetical protein [Marinobacter sp. S0848L]